MGEFQLAKAAGFSEIGAAFAGREVATDFGMRGSSKLLNFFNRNTMFFNASIQGLYRTSRVFFEQPGKAAGREAKVRRRKVKGQARGAIGGGNAFASQD